MSQTRKAAIAVAAALGLFLVAVFAAGGWLFYTPSGLVWLTARLVGLAGEGLAIEAVAGTLARGARIKSIRFAGEDIEVRVTEAHLAVSPLSVLTLAPRITRLTAESIAVTTKPGEPRERPPDTLALPVNLSGDRAYVKRLAIDTGDGPIDIEDVRLSYFGGRSRHTLRDVSLNAFGYAAALNGHIEAQAPFVLDASFAAIGRETPARAFGRATGTLSQIKLEAGGRAADGRISATALIEPYSELQLGELTLEASALDLSAVLADLPKTEIAAHARLQRRSGVLTGPVALRNTIPGPYDKGRLPLEWLRASIASDFNALGFTDLEADLGAAGTIVGTVDVEPGHAVLELRTGRLDLSALHTRMRETRLAGRARAVLTPERQSVTAHLAQDGIALDATAHRSGEVIEVPSFRASARGGVATGEARVNLAGARPVSLQARLERFDPAVWGDFPSGSLNAHLSATATLAARAATVDFEIVRSRWLGAPLSGRGHVRLTPERLQRADVAVTLGGNRLRAQGAFGTPRDTLAVQFDASHLSLIDKRLRGSLRGTAKVSGTFRTPRVRFDAAGSALAHEAYGRVRSLRARGRVNLQKHGEMNVRATLNGVETPRWTLRNANLELDGNTSSHTAVLRATGNRVDFHMSARGAWEPNRGWSGTLLELGNRGAAPIQLVAPVALTVGPNRVHVEPLILRALGGTLAVASLDYAKGHIATTGRLERLPVVPLLALAGKPGAVGGDLRLSGSWDLRTTPQLTGHITLARTTGDLVLTAGRRFALDLQELAASATLRERGLTFEARVRAPLATAFVEGTVGAVSRGGAVLYGPTSPVVASATVDVARLAPFAAFIETAMLVSGEAHAQVQVRGTVREPQVTGRVTAQRLSFALPAEGVSLSGGSLNALVTEREIRLESFSTRGGEGLLTARGTLARARFDTASLYWRAERFTALARPDRKLVVSGNGTAALQEGKLSLAGTLRADEGEFQVGGAALPTLSDDVVIVGRTAPTRAEQNAAAGRLQRLALDLRIELSNAVRVAAYGLSVWLAGDVRVFTSRQGDIRGRGTVTARNGTFAAYGQRLEITRGRLYFNGPIANPALDIVAMRPRQALEVGVAVTGTLRNPLVRVVSDPPLPQGEALSWLVLGRPADQASSGELSGLPLASSLVIGKAADPLKKALGLDELGFRGAGAGEQFLTLGKRITDRLYTGFEQGLGAAESLLRLEYTLTQRILLRLQAGEPTSAGVFYRRTWD